MLSLASRLRFATRTRQFGSSARELVQSLVRTDDSGHVRVHLNPGTSALTESESAVNKGPGLSDCVAPDDLPAGVAEIVVSNPSRRNAITARAAIDFAQALDELEAWSASGAVSAVIVRGASGACDAAAASGSTAGAARDARGAGAAFFCAGMDLGLAGSLSREEALAVCELMSSTLRRLHGLGAVSIAAIEGGAFGGGAELSTACDHRVAGGDDVAVRFVHASMGLVPGWGGAGRLTGLVGRTAALRLLTTARRCGAQEALRIGLVDEVVPSGMSRGGALQWVAEVVRFAPQVVRANKAAVAAAASGTDAPLALAAAMEGTSAASGTAALGHEAMRASQAEAALFRQLWGGEANEDALRRVAQKRV